MDSVIITTGLKKEYTRYEKEEGFIGSVKSLFKGAFKVLFYLVLPYGIMATIPTQFFSGVLSPTGFICSIAVVVVFTAFTLVFWRFGLRNYKSAGS